MPPTKKTPAAILDYLYSLTTKGIHLGLDRVQKFLAVLNHPERDFKSIHIAGTNGKGTIAHLTYAACREAGFRTGLYTSPHLLRFNERIVVDGVQIPDAYLVAFVKQYRPYFDRFHLTFFEITTALAFKYFQDQKVEVAIVETGLGGRLDATNTLTPLVSVICDIARDHEQYLGNTLQKIAGEKAGIIKDNIPAVYGIRDSGARKVVAGYAKKGIDAFRASRVRKIRETAVGSRFEVRVKGESPLRINLPLAGRHQVGNAQIALTALRTAFPALPRPAIKRAFEKIEMPGRLQLIPGKPPILLDVSHNLAGIAALAAHLKKFYARRRLAIVFGAMADKNYKEMIATLEPRAAKLIVTQPATPRSAKISDLMRWTRRGIGVPSVARAVSEAKKAAGLKGVVVVAGSFYTAAEALQSLRG